MYFLRQPDQAEFGHAVLCAEQAVGSDSFAVMLADDFHTYEGEGVSADFARAFEASGKTEFSVMEFNRPDISKHVVIVANGNQDQLRILLKSLMLKKRLRT